MAQEGIYWFNDGPANVAQKFSAFSRILPRELELIVAESVDEASASMRSRVTELNRIRSGAMLRSIGGETTTTSAGRIRAKWGYINEAPYWSLFQEYGTRGRHGGADRHVNPKYGLKGGPEGSGISPMHAFVDSAVELDIKIHERFNMTDFWREAGLR